MVVDDHPLFREGVAAILSGEPGLSVVAEAADGLEAIEKFRHFVPDVTLMDLEMPRLGGVDAIRIIRQEYSEAAILVLTTYRGDAQAAQALRTGARGYVLKSTLRRELVDAIRSLYVGRRYIPADIAAEVIGYAIEDELTNREILILEYVAAGQPNKIVARELRISEDTVKTHMKNILSKLNARGRTHAVTIALKRGIISLREDSFG
jgi:DNA-binding NarL/FixJ family response regulator